ncbi:MAG TPA: fibronectin type III domain-containing protein [Longimicrobiales bacterium]|nr:fibronectin type III domain-containing protein [Longimicrobiales bacterium]
MWKRHLSLAACPPRALLAGSLLAAAGCSEVSITTVPPAVVEISPSTASVQVDATERLTASVKSSDGAVLSGRTITWRSLDPDIAEVDAEGTVLGLAPGTATIQATTGGVTGSATVTVAPARLIAGPGSVAATTVSATQIQVSWSYGGDIATHFEVQRATQSDPEAFATVATVGALARSYPDSGLEPASTYHYRVRACSLTVCSGWSSTASANTATFTPAVPGNVSATALSDSEILVTWNASAGAASYDIQRRRGNSSWSFLITVPGGTTQYQDRGLNDDTRYYYQVRACAGGSCSAYSNVASAQTDDD